MAETFTRFH